MFEDIDTTIQSVERLYRAVSGRDANGAQGAPIPPERDAGKHVDDQLDRLLGALAKVPAAVAAAANVDSPPPAWAPPVTVFVKKTELVICLDLPGVPRESITVSATPLIVTVSGRRPATFEDPEVRLASAEAPYGAFSRDVALPPDLFLSDLTATLKDGVLELRLPRATKPTAKPITIQ